MAAFENQSAPFATASAGSIPISDPHQPLRSGPGLRWLLIITALCLVPFLTKPFNIDDTLFLRAAEQIQKHPLDFYGCPINWYGTTMPLHEVFENPPLTSYYIAVVAAIFGWSEPALHLAFLIPALAAAWGVFALARNFCRQPAIAFAAAILTPGFLVSATTIMCDVMLLAFWIWSVVMFERGLQRNSVAAFVWSGLLAGLAVLTKFPGLGLVPLLGVYGCVRQRSVGRWIWTLIIPLSCAAVYELMTRSLYGHGLFVGAARFAVGARTAPEGHFVDRFVLGLEFVGGCFLPLLLCIPWMWSRRGLMTLLGIAVLCVLVLPTLAPMARALWHENEPLKWGRLLQITAFTLGGISLVFLVSADCWKRRDATSLLLFLWVSGIFFFATVVNWTLNGRSLLPMAPAIGILMARRLDVFLAEKHLQSVRIALAAAALLALLPVMGDYTLAKTDRDAAKELCAKYRRRGRTIWFQGHWGFQYYMEAEGALPFDRKTSAPSEHDTLIVPFNASNVWKPAENSFRSIETALYGTNRFCTTMSREDGAGFYGAILGPMPFVLGRIAPNRFEVFEVTASPARERTAIVSRTRPVMP